MEIEKHNQEGEGTELTQQVVTDLAPLSIIRTEATLSRFPIHVLAKKGNVNIHIVKKTANGEVDVKWIVSHNSQAGRPGQLAYKLDTIIINRRIDEAREQQKLLPEIIRLGSLYQIAQELGLGRDTNSVRKALLQNSGANIDAKIRYTTIDGVEREVTFNDTRYGVLFTGEKFSDGRKADAVYLSLHRFYREVLNSSPFRPLNYDYLKELPPAAQRFYEIVSRKIFATLKYGHSHAKLLYSEFCTFSAQRRQIDYDHFKKQMYKVHRPHIKSGYISKVHFEPTTDEEGKSDWLMLYTPGPKAKLEFNTFNGGTRVTKLRRRNAVSKVPAAKIFTQNQTTTEGEDRHEQHEYEQNESLIKAQDQTALLLPSPTRDRELVEPKILTALIDRGIFETNAAKLLASLRSDRLETVPDYIDYWDSIPPHKRGTGLLYSLIQNSDPLPASFETRRQREKRLADEDRRQKLRIVKETLTAEYEQYQQRTIDHFIANEITSGEFDRRVAARKKELSSQTTLNLHSIWNRGDVLKSQALHEIRAQIEKEMSFLPFEDFRKRELPRILSELQLDPAELGIELPPTSTA